MSKDRLEAFGYFLRIELGWLEAVIASSAPRSSAVSLAKQRIIHYSKLLATLKQPTQPLTYADPLLPLTRFDWTASQIRYFEALTSLEQESKFLDDINEVADYLNEENFDDLSLGDEHSFWFEISECFRHAFAVAWLFEQNTENQTEISDQILKRLLLPIRDRLEQPLSDLTIDPVLAGVNETMNLISLLELITPWLDRSVEWLSTFDTSHGHLLLAISDLEELTKQQIGVLEEFSAQADLQTRAFAKIKMNFELAASWIQHSGSDSFTETELRWLSSVIDVLASSAILSHLELNRITEHPTSFLRAMNTQDVLRLIQPTDVSDALDSLDSFLLNSEGNLLLALRQGFLDLHENLEVVFDQADDIDGLDMVSDIHAGQSALDKLVNSRYCWIGPEPVLCRIQADLRDITEVLFTAAEELHNPDGSANRVFDFDQLFLVPLVSQQQLSSVGRDNAVPVDSRSVVFQVQMQIRRLVYWLSKAEKETMDSGQTKSLEAVRTRLSRIEQSLPALNQVLNSPTSNIDLLGPLGRTFQPPSRN